MSDSGIARALRRAWECGTLLALCLALTGLVMPDMPAPRRYEQSPLTVFREQRAKTGTRRALENPPGVVAPRRDTRETRMRERSGRLHLPGKNRY